VRRAVTFVEPIGSATCVLPAEGPVTIPVVVGILKHPTPDALPRLLERPAVARKYTMEALRIAPWPVLRLFPRQLLRARLEEAMLPPGRRRALEFLLGPAAD